MTQVAASRKGARTSLTPTTAAARTHTELASRPSDFAASGGGSPIGTTRR